MPRDQARIWALIPAAGTGSRVGDPLPKQYLKIGRQTMLEHAVGRLLAMPWITSVIVVCAPLDRRAAALFSGEARVRVIPRGGETRRDSVLGGLQALQETEPTCRDDWVFVHDAARPGLGAVELERLRAAVLPADDSHAPDCALLATPVADTVKRIRPGTLEVETTVDRSVLWLAQTPQACTVARLIEALQRTASATDEASAIEAVGGRVAVVQGAGTNFKVTTRDDLERMRVFLETT